MHGSNTAELGDVEFRLLRDLIYRYSGMWFHEAKKYLLERRLSPRLQVTGARSFAEYARMLRYGTRGRKELEEVIDRVTVNETYFFREDYQLKAFTDEILPEIKAEQPRGKKLRIWSAGCSSGEEPYTISMLLLEHGGFDDWDVQIIGSDISRKVLRQATRARYRRSSLRQTSAVRQRRFFVESGDHYELPSEVKAPVSFARLNLFEDLSLDLVGTVDVLFCRNVFIYFDGKSRSQVTDSFYKRLRTGGYLLLGHSETLMNLSTEFELVQLRNDTVYRKPRSMESRPDDDERRW